MEQGWGWRCLGLLLRWKNKCPIPEIGKKWRIPSRFLKSLKVLITLDARRSPKRFQHLTQIRCLRKSRLMSWTSSRRSVPTTHYYSLLVQYNTEMFCSLYVRTLTPLVLVQEVLKYRQHPTHTNPIVFEDNPLSWWKSHGHHCPTRSRFTRRFLTIFPTSCPVGLLWIVKARDKDKTYKLMSVWWKTKN